MYLLDNKAIVAIIKLPKWGKIKMSAKSEKELQRSWLKSIKYLDETGQCDKAMAEMLRYRERYPENVYGKYQYGKMLMQRGDFAAAKEVLNELIWLRSENMYSCLIVLGRIAELEGKLDEARKYYEDAQNCNTHNDSKALLCLAELQRLDGFPQTALRLIEESTIRSPRIQIMISKCYVDMGEYDRAEKVLSSIEVQEPDEKREVLIGKGKIYAGIGKYPDAMKCFQQARFGEMTNGRKAVKDKIYYAATLELAILAGSMYNYDEQLSYCRELSEAKQNFHGLVDLLFANAYIARGDYQIAREYLGKAIITNNYSIKSTATFKLGALHLLTGECDSAEKVLHDTIEQSEKPPRICYAMLIKILYTQGEYDKARKYLATIKEKDRYLEDDSTFYKLELLLDKAQGNKLPSREDNLEYAERQLVQYSREEALKKIKDCHTRNPQNGISMFSEIKDVESIFEEVKLQLDPKTQLSIGTAMDEYEIEYPEVGFLDGKILNHVRVVTIPGTKDIITMYPCRQSELPTYGRYNDAIQALEQKPPQKSIMLASVNPY